MSLTDSIVLGNSAPDFAEILGVRSLNGVNIIGTDVFDGMVDDGDTTAASVFAQVSNGAGVLADNGGLVPTIALLANDANPAVDATSNGLTEDARGFDRPIDFGAVSAQTADLGAFELQEIPSLIVTTTDDDVDPVDFETSLREAILFANSNPDTSTIPLTRLCLQAGRPSFLTAINLL